ncbi:MAG: lipoyl(octanoyl) transferase LipB [Solirubrobacterales bacterium]
MEGRRQEGQGRVTTPGRVLEGRWLGTRPYPEMLTVQEKMVGLRQAARIPDTLLLLEHPSTYTLGRRSEPSDRAGLDLGDETAVVEPPRGGRITWHGPGQLVAYPVIDLKGIGDQPGASARVDVARFVESLERAMVASLEDWGVEARTIEGLTGIWTFDPGGTPSGADAGSLAQAIANGAIRKVGSIGLRVSRGVTSHGISLNLSCDLGPFDRIEACGIDGCRMTSVEEETGGAPDPEQAGLTFHRALAGELDLEPVLPESSPADSILSP